MSLPTETAPESEYEHGLPAKSALERWFLFDGNRAVITGIVLFGVLSTSLAAGLAGLVDLRNESAVTLLLSVLIGGNFTLISIVITINQLVLSREFGKPHAIRQRNEGIERLRNDVVDLIDAPVAPEGPSRFLHALMSAIVDQGDVLRDSADPGDDAGAPRPVSRFGESIVDQTRFVCETLEREEFGSFSVLSALLFYRNGWMIQAVNRLRVDHREALTDEQRAAFDRLKSLFHQFQIARQYVMTLYLQAELASLSRLLLYVGTPILVFLSLSMLVYRPDGGLTIGSDWLLPGFVVAATAAFTPLAILLSYVVRVSTVTSRMPLVSPFVNDG